MNIQLTLHIAQIVLFLIVVGFGLRARRLYKDQIADLKEEVRFWKKEHTNLSENNRGLKKLSLTMVTSHRQMHEAIYNCAEFMPKHGKADTIALADKANKALDKAKAALEKY